MILLAVYLAWICGYTVIDLGCYVERQRHHVKYHLTHCEECDCHHDGWQIPHFESPHACNHDHSVDVKLYDIAKRSDSGVEPLILHIARTYIVDIAEVEQPLHPHYDYARKIPLPTSPDIFGCGLRAPPVVA